MNAKTAVLDSPAQQWRAHCQQHPDRFLPVRGTPVARKRIERCEEHMIEQLDQIELPLGTRAVAFRTIMELRGSTARDVAVFFGVDPQVVVLGLSLLNSASRRETQAVPSEAVADSASRTRAA